METVSASPQLKARIRKYRSTDAPSVIEIFKAGMLEHGRTPELLALFEEYVEDCVQNDVGHIEELYDLDKPPTSRGLGCFWVAVHPDDDNGILGMVGLKSVNSENKIAEIKRLSVREAARRSGVARQLVGQLESWAAEQGFSKMILMTNDFMRPACLFWEANGFVEDRREVDPADGYTMVYYEKSLASVSEAGSDT